MKRHVIVCDIRQTYRYILKKYYINPFGKHGFELYGNTLTH